MRLLSISEQLINEGCHIIDVDSGVTVHIGGGTLDGDIVIEQQVDKRGQVIDADPAVAVQLSVPQTYSSFINNSSIIRAKSLMVT